MKRPWARRRLSRSDVAYATLPSAARPREAACAARELVGGFERASGQLSLGLLTKLLRRTLGWLSAGEVAMARVQAAAE